MIGDIWQLTVDSCQLSVDSIQMTDAGRRIKGDCRLMTDDIDD